MLAAVLSGVGAAWLALVLLTRPSGFRPAAHVVPTAARAANRRVRPHTDPRRVAAWAGCAVGGALVWLTTGNPVAGGILAAAAATLPGAVEEMATARQRDRRERELGEFAAACADALAVESAMAQALVEAGRDAAPWLGAEVHAVLARHAAGLSLAAALRQRAAACHRRDLGLLLRLLAALAERGGGGSESVGRLVSVLRHRRELRAERRAELAGHSIFALVLFGLPPVAYMGLVSLWPTAQHVLRHTLVGQMAVAFAAASEAGAWLALRKAARWVE